MCSKMCIVFLFTFEFLIELIHKNVCVTKCYDFMSVSILTIVTVYTHSSV